MSKFANRLQNCIKFPLYSEKTAKLEGQKILVLQVAKDTNKVEVAQAVKTLWGFDVVSVNILNVKGKTKNRGNRKGRRSDVKKAYVRLSADAQLHNAETAVE